MRKRLASWSKLAITQFFCFNVYPHKISLGDNTNIHLLIILNIIVFVPWIIIGESLIVVRVRDAIWGSNGTKKVTGVMF